MKVATFAQDKSKRDLISKQFAAKIMSNNSSKMGMFMNSASFKSTTSELNY